MSNLPNQWKPTQPKSLLWKPFYEGLNYNYKSLLDNLKPKPKKKLKYPKIKKMTKKEDKRIKEKREMIKDLREFFNLPKYISKNH